MEPRAGHLRDLHAAGPLAEDVEWWVAGPPDALPWAGTVQGYAGIVRWHEALNDAMDDERFEVVEATGRPFESEVVRFWSFRDGRVVRVRSYDDTAAYLAAYRGPRVRGDDGAEGGRHYPAGRGALG